MFMAAVNTAKKSKFAGMTSFRGLGEEGVLTMLMLEVISIFLFLKERKTSLKIILVSYVKISIFRFHWVLSIM